MLERHHLAIVRAVVREGTLTKAAQSLFLTQSALSHTMRKLEEQLGTPIWEKDGRQVRLTQAGDYLLHLADIILPQFERGEEQLNAYALGRKGNLRIGMECYPCYQWLLKSVHPYLDKWPDVDLDVHQQFQFKGIAALYAYEIDILITPDPMLADGLTFIPVYPYEQVFVLSEQHPLAKKARIEPQDLRTETLITYPVPVERLDVFQQFLLPAECNVAHHQTIENTDILLEMVAANRGITTLPKWLIEEKNSNLPLVTKPIGASGLHKHINLGIRENDSQIDYIQGFIDEALAQAPASFQPNQQ